MDIPFSVFLTTVLPQLCLSVWGVVGLYGSPYTAIYWCTQPSIHETRPLSYPTSFLGIYLRTRLLSFPTHLCTILHYIRKSVTHRTQITHLDWLVMICAFSGRRVNGTLIIYDHLKRFPRAFKKLKCQFCRSKLLQGESLCAERWHCSDAIVWYKWQDCRNSKRST